MPDLYIIAGPNGSGKTTVAQVVLPNIFNCHEFVNADSIAAGLSPLSPESSALQAGKLMLKRIDMLLSEKKTFAFETTLASVTFVRLIKKAKKLGYRTHLIFLYLPNYKLAQKRVKERVSKGGHNIEPDVIKRRFTRGLHNFIYLYYNKVDTWVLLDNSKAKPSIIAEKRKPQDDSWQKLLKKLKKNKA